VTSNVKGQIERKISKSKNLQNFHLLGALEIRGYEKLRFLLQKYRPCVNARRLTACDVAHNRRTRRVLCV